VSQNFTCNLAGAGGGRPEIGARSDASLRHIDHDGNLRSDCAVVAAASTRTAIGVCPSRRSRFTVQFTVHYGPIRWVF
jgi:hypothetical protein